MPAVLRNLLPCAAALLAIAGTRADDLPSPDAMWLGQRIVPHAIVDGYRDALGEEVLQKAVAGRVAGADLPPLRARARAAMAPLLDEAFPPELLAGFAAQFLARHYTADELRTLRAREESPLGRKLRDFTRSAAEAATPSGKEGAREALARRTFTDGEQKELEAFAASPLGKKGLALAPDLAGFFVDQLDRRYASLRPDLEPRLQNVAEAVLMTK
jgi:hypothetical protein